MSYTPDEKVALVTAWFNEIDGIISALQKLPSAAINYHGKIKKALIDLYGSIDINMANRLIDINVLHESLSKKICPICLEKSTLKLFSVSEVIYRFGRCKAVHEGEFITLGYINLPLLMTITQNIAMNLKNECIKEKNSLMNFNPSKFSNTSLS